MANVTHAVADQLTSPTQHSSGQLLEETLAVLVKLLGRDAVRESARNDDFAERITTAPRLYKDWSQEGTSPYVLSQTTLPKLNEFGIPELEWQEVVSRQPAGMLSGKIIYCSGGHGWTCDNTSTSLWYTQRPLTFGIVEDYGNLDQLNMFANIAWRAGATIVSFRPLGNQPIERVLDNSDKRHVKFVGQWYDSSSPLYYGRVIDNPPYRFAVADTTESAKARYQPYLPKSDFYPVYSWVRDGKDRVPQVYRIRHAGGLSEVTVDHRKVGKGWVFLGEYYFKQGSEGYVEIINAVSDPSLADGKHVVVADAIRFGNGMGDINRGGGISGFPREEEASKYWVEAMVPVGAPPIFEPNEASDQDNNVGAPPRMAAYMNRETEGTFLDRIYVGFHSNAVGGRGTVGLFEKDPDKRPDWQVEFAQLVARQLNEDLATTGNVSLPVTWEVRKKLTDSHINFGEIRRDALNNEMCATILEVAFHDNPLDAALLRMPAFREAVAVSAVKAIGRFFSDRGALRTPLVLPPDAPQLLLAEARSSDTVYLVWMPPRENPAHGGAVRGYRIYRSSDGIAFGGGLDVGLTTAVLVRRLPGSTPNFFRVTAVNEGGESQPSEVLGTFWSGLGEARRHLLMYGFTTLSEDLALSQSVAQGLGSPLHDGGEFIRIIPRKMNARNYAAFWGQALAECGLSFDSCLLTSMTADRLEATSYSMAHVILGRQKPEESPFEPKILTRCQNFVRQGGTLVLSGSRILECVRAGERKMALAAGKSTKTLPRWAQEYTTSPLTIESVRGTKDSSLRDTAFMLDDGSGDSYRARHANEGFLPRNGKTLLRYGGVSDKYAAGFVSREGKGSVVVLGFPVECIQPPQERTHFLSLLVGDLSRPTQKAGGAKFPQAVTVGAKKATNQK